MPLLKQPLIVVTGLPRSGTSMVMQMLAAGGLPVLSDGLHQPDEDNPRGYLELERVKALLRDSEWLFEGRGKAIKIVAPLVPALPPGLPCRVIVCEREIDEVIDSQERMLARRSQPPPAEPERRRMLKDEYVRTLIHLKTMLARRPKTKLLPIDYRHAIAHPLDTAQDLSRFLGGGLDVEKMAAAIDRALYRNRAAL